jgi:hypothetical protein
MQHHSAFKSKSPVVFFFCLIKGTLAMALTDRVATLKGLLPLEALQIIMRYDSHPTADLMKEHFLKIAIEEAQEELLDVLEDVDSIDDPQVWDELDAAASKLMTFPALDYTQHLLERVVRAYGNGLDLYGRQPSPEIIAYLTARNPLFLEMYPLMLSHPDLF